MRGNRAPREQRAPRKKGSEGSNMFSIDPKLFELPQDETLNFKPVNMDELLKDTDVSVNENDIDENDPELLKELSRAVSSSAVGHHGIMDGRNDNVQLNLLKQQLIEEQEALALFEHEGCAEEAGELRAQVESLKARIADMEMAMGKINPQVLQEMEQRYNELRQAAAAWNKAGDKSRAIEYLRLSKSVKPFIDSGQLMETLPPPPEMPQLLDHGTDIPRKAQQQQQQQQHQQQRPLEIVSSPVRLQDAVDPFEGRIREAKELLDRLRSSKLLRKATEEKKWDLMIGALKEEARKCNALALQYKETDKKIAVDFFRRQKESMALLEKAIQLKGAGLSCAKWDQSETYQVKRITSNTDVADEAMHVHIIRGGDVVTEKGSPASSYVKLIYSYHPKDGDEDTVFQSATTAAARAPEWNFAQILPIQRKKTFQKWLERKDLKVELWESRGWLKGDRLIGRADISMKPLLKQCTIKGIVPVLNNRKRVGPQLEVIVKMRHPLMCMEEEVLEEKFIKVLEWPELGKCEESEREDAEERRIESEIESLIHQQQEKSVKVSHRPAPPVPAVTQNQKNEKEEETKSAIVAPKTPDLVLPVVETPAEASPPVASVPAPVLKPAAKKQGSTAGKVARNELDDVRSVDLICSVAVLDWEIANCKSDDDGQMRKTDLEIKKQMMMMSIQMGTLELEEYASNLSKRILQDKKLAKDLVALGRKEDAMYCLQRAKVMEKEMEG